MLYNFDEITDRSGTASLKYDKREAIFRNGEVIPMWVADMDFRTPPFIIDAIAGRLKHEILGYTYVPPSFGESAADWILRKHNWKVNPAWISFAPGVVPALSMLVLAFTRPGDKIIIQPPVYFPFFSVVTAHGRKLVTNPLKYSEGRYCMDFDDLENKALGAKMMILCSPHNPTGNVWSRNDLEKLLDICLRNNIILVSDEIHADLVYDPFTHIPVAGISEEALKMTITCMSPSKTFNMAGLSTAYVIIKDPAMMKKYREECDRYHTGSGNIFGSVALEAAYNSGKEWLDQLMAYLDGNVKLLSSFIEKNIPGIRVVRPEATFMTWLDCTGLGLDHGSLNDFLIKKAKLGLSDGMVFGEEGRGFQRINIGCPRSILDRALINLKKTLPKFY
jgi:cysteine-S-conjugate beta-lyase